MRHFLVSLQWDLLDRGKCFWGGVSDCRNGITSCHKRFSLSAGTTSLKERLVGGYRCHWLWVFAHRAERTTNIKLIVCNGDLVLAVLQVGSVEVHLSTVDRSVD